MVFRKKEKLKLFQKIKKLYDPLFPILSLPFLIPAVIRNNDTTTDMQLFEICPSCVNKDWKLDGINQKKQIGQLQ